MALANVPDQSVELFGILPLFTELSAETLFSEEELVHETHKFPDYFISLEANY